MKKMNFLIAAVLLGSTLFIASCKKDDSSNNNNNTTPTNSTPTVTTPSNADGAFVAINTITYTTVLGSSYATTIGTAAGWFGSATTAVDGGTLECNSNALTKQSNNGYIYIPGASNPTGLDLDGTSNVTWTFGGNSATGVPAFTKVHSGYFPHVGNVNVTGDVATNADFTLSSTETITGNDSTIFIVSGPKGSVHHTKGPYTNSCTFTAAEMATLGTGSNQGLLQIAPYTVELDASHGKYYYFVKESVVSKFVTLK